MKWRLLERDAHSGLDTWHAYDQDTEETHLKTTPIEGLVEAVLDQNKQDYNDGTNGYITKDREMKRVAQIPVWVQHKWLIEEGLDVFDKNAWPQVKRKLNSSEWLFLRTSPGTI